MVTFKFQYTVHNVAFPFLFEYIFLLGFQAQKQVHLCIHAMSPMQYLHLFPYLRTVWGCGSFFYRDGGPSLIRSDSTYTN